MVFHGENSYRYFTGCKDDYYKIRPSHITLPKTNAYVKKL